MYIRILEIFIYKYTLPAPGVVMKRKISQMGPSSLVVSLPSKWVKRHGVKKGDEIHVDEKAGELHLKLDGTKSSRVLSVDVSQAGSMINRMLCSVYKAGVDEVTIKFDNAQELHVLQDTLARTCQTFEIMSIGKNTMQVKSVSELNPDEFDQILRKMSQTVNTIADEALEAIKTKDYESLKQLELHDKMVDRHTDFLRRTLNSGKAHHHELPCALYVICEQTEILADIYKKLIIDMYTKQKEMSKEELKLFAQINELLRTFYSALHEFSNEKIIELGKKEVSIRKEIDRISELSTTHPKTFSYLVNLFETGFEMKSALMTYKWGNYGVQ